MPLQFGPRLKAFLDQPLPITIGTTRKDGSVQMNPVWYEYRDGQIWLNGGPGRGWVKHLARDPRITVFVMDPNKMFRWAQIQGRFADSTAEGADDHIEHLSQRYTGGPYRNPKVDRLIVRIDPERVTGFESGTPWDVTLARHNLSRPVRWLNSVVSVSNRSRRRARDMPRPAERRTGRSVAGGTLPAAGCGRYQS